MDKKTLEELKKKMEEEKKSLEKELAGFAQRDKQLKGDWDTRFPKFNESRLEEAADEVEQYENLLPVEHALEIKLKDIDLALEKVEKAGYGLCEKCQQEIEEERLKIMPEAKTCSRCK